MGNGKSKPKTLLFIIWEYSINKEKFNHKYYFLCWIFIRIRYINQLTSQRLSQLWWTRFLNCKFKNCSLKNCSFVKAEFEGIKFESCSFEKAERGSLSKAWFESCHFIETNFNGFNFGSLIATAVEDSKFSKFNKTIEFQGSNRYIRV